MRGSPTTEYVMSVADKMGVNYRSMVETSCREQTVPKSYDRKSGTCKVGFAVKEIFVFEDGSEIRRIKGYSDVREYCALAIAG